MLGRAVRGDRGLPPARRMAAVTLWRPWPWAVFRADPPKRVENRSWAPKRSQLEPGAWLAIHAGRKWEGQALVTIRFVDPRCPAKDSHPTGIAGVALYRGYYRLTEPETGRDRDLRRMVQENGSSSWVTGPLVWVFDEVVGFDEPVPCSGERGLWELPFDVETLVLQKMRRGF